ncbi:PITH domain-containing protein [Toxocara canis]|uniref:PITH domain-containing protein n=1 Tax=Toxocara canis TaxID=6265 RepID=A0A0B2VU00_TOXCA|nr:PITH domain-containing protein [Toxocara canis]
MCSHGHGHGGGCEQEYTPVVQGAEGVLYTMNHHIDLDKVVVLNETVEGSGAKVFKDWENRMDRSDFVESDVDEELLFNVPFRGHVKIMGIVIGGDLDSTHPSHMKIYKGRPLMSFEDGALAPDQEFALKQDARAEIDYALKGAKFSDVTHLSLYFPSNFGAERTRIYYIGLRGEYLSDMPSEVPIATYESRPMLKDHKANIPDNALPRSIF